MAAGRVSETYILPCRYCGEAVAVRMASGRLLPMGPVEMIDHGRLNISCPSCGRDTRVNQPRRVDRTRGDTRQ